MNNSHPPPGPGGRPDRKVTAGSKADFTTDSSRISAWRKVLHLDPPEPVAPEAAVRQAAGNIKVKPSLNSRIVDVLCDSVNPKLAAEFANTMAQEYITD